MAKKRSIIWVDYVKIFACIFVVLGHLYMSFMETGWIDKTSVFYCLPIQVVYSFHVQLFFVCSGFLYQKFRKDTSVKGHFKSVLNKAIVLGVPYFVFSIITLVIKNVFSGSVNTQTRSVFETLFIKPMAPYWYLYVLFLLFLIIPCVNDKRKLWLIFFISLALKIVYVVIPIRWPYVIDQLANHSIWFTVGMILTEVKFKYNYIEKTICILLGLVGSALSVIFFRADNNSKTIHFLVSTLLVISLLYLFVWVSKNSRENMSARLRKYILPIFLMHTIFAAGVRIVLFKLGIHLVSVHIIAGLVASFALPMLVYMLVKKKWYLLIFIEPIKAWRMRNNK